MPAATLMSKAAGRALILGAACACLLGGISPGRADDTPTHFRVILDRDNLPYSSVDGVPQGLDAEIAAELALRIQRPLQIFWTDTLEEGLLTPVVRPGGEADAAVGVPVEASAVEDQTRVGERVLYSLPYASTGYVLVTTRNHAPLTTMKDVGRTIVGVEVGSVAASQLWDEGYLLRQFGAQDRILNAIASGDLEYGVVWGNGGWEIEHDAHLRDSLKIQSAPIDMRKPRWNVAVAVGHHNRGLLPLIDGAIVAMKRDGVFEQLFQKYGIPYFEPLDEEGTFHP